MTDASPSLYGDQPEPPQVRAPGLMEQVLGVFTEPVALFRRLRQAPAWGPAMALLVGAAVVITVIWGLKVDVDEMLRPILERNPQISASQIDTVIEMQKKFILPFGILGALLATPAALAVAALFYWLVGKGLHEEGKPSYLQALSAAAVPSLVKLPHLLLVAIICLVRPIGGLTPEKIAPTSLGYFIHTEGVKIHALLYSIDLFYLAEAVLTYMALRHLLRLKGVGAWIGVLIPMAVGIGFRVLGAK